MAIVEVLIPGLPGPAGPAMTIAGPALAGRITGTGALERIALGAGLEIVGGALTVTVAGGGYPAFSAPTGFSVSGSGTSTIALSFAAGYSLPTTVKQGQWDTAYGERLQWDGGSGGLNAATARASLGLGTAALAASGDFAAAGAPAAAVAGHEAAADPHPQYLTTAEGNAAYATAAQGAKADAAAVAGAIGSSGLTMTAGLLGRESGTGAPQVYSLGSGLSIVAGALTVTAGGNGTVTSVGLSVPAGFSVAGSPVTSSGTLVITYAAGYSLPTTASQSNWDTAYSERLRWDGGATGLNAATARTSLELGTAATTAASSYATAAQGALADTAVQPAVLSSYLTSASAASTYQPLDADLTSIAALSTTTFGRSLLTQADAAATRTAIGAGTSSLALSSSAPANLAATASAGTSTDAARADHIHQRSTPAEIGALPTTFSPGTVSYAATTDLNMSTLAGTYQTLSLTGNLTLTTSNRAAGRAVTIRLVSDASSRTLTFPTGWVFVGTKPTALAASKTAVLTVAFFGTADTDAVAAYAVQS